MFVFCFVFTTSSSRFASYVTNGPSGVGKRREARGEDRGGECAVNERGRQGKEVEEEEEEAAAEGRRGGGGGEEGKKESSAAFQFTWQFTLRARTPKRTTNTN